MPIGDGLADAALTDEQRNRMLALHQEGHNNSEIARLVGVQERTVAEVLSEAGVFWVSVYDPPSAGMPYVVVACQPPDSRLSATPYTTEAEALDEAADLMTRLMLEAHRAEGEEVDEAELVTRLMMDGFR